MAKNKNSSLVLLLFFVIVALIVAFIYKDEIFPPENIQEKEKIAEDIISNNCEKLADYSSEYIEREFVSDLVSFLVSNRCDCIKEIIAPKFAEKHTLKELEELKNMPAHVMVELKNLLIENKVEIKDCSRLFKKKN